MTLPSNITVVARDLLKSTAHCKYCGRQIQFVTRTSTTKPNGQQSFAKTVPIQPHPLVLRYDRTELGMKLAVISADALHFGHCPRRPQPVRSTTRRPWRNFGGRA